MEKEGLLNLNRFVKYIQKEIKYILSWQDSSNQGEKYIWKSWKGIKLSSPLFLNESLEMRLRYTFEKTGMHKEFLAISDISYFPCEKQKFLCFRESYWADSIK